VKRWKIGSSNPKELVDKKEELAEKAQSIFKVKKKGTNRT
jgi:hypothetical protein